MTSGGKTLSAVLAVCKSPAKKNFPPLVSIAFPTSHSQRSASIRREFPYGVHQADKPTHSARLLKIEPQLWIPFGRVAVLLVEQTGLNVATPLVFGAGILLNIATNLMVKDLADS